MLQVYTLWMGEHITLPHFIDDIMVHPSSHSHSQISTDGIQTTVTSVRDTVATMQLIKLRSFYIANYCVYSIFVDLSSVSTVQRDSWLVTNSFLILG